MCNLFPNRWANKGERGFALVCRGAGGAVYGNRGGRPAELTDNNRKMPDSERTVLALEGR